MSDELQFVVVTDLSSSSSVKLSDYDARQTKVRRT